MRRVGGRGSLAVLLVAGALAYTYGCVETSSRIGRLSVPPGYDDVVYFVDAGRRLARFEEHGIAALASDLWHVSLHAPLSTGLAMVAFQVAGMQPRAAYLVNACVVLAYLFLLDRMLRPLDAVTRSLLLGAFLGLPFATMAVVEFRPDLAWAIVTGFLGVWLLTRAAPVDRRRDALLAGALLGGALVAKPSTFAMSGLVGLLAVAGALYVRAGEPDGLDRRRVWSALALAGLALGAVAAPYWIPHGLDAVRYFVTNSFVDIEKWDPGGFSGRDVGYYVVGAGKDSNLGAWFVALPLAVILALLRDVIEPVTRRRSACLLGLIVAVGVVNALARQKSPFLGGAYYGLLVFACADSLRRFLERLGTHTSSPRAAPRAVAAVLLTAAVLVYRWPAYSDWTSNGPLWVENARGFDAWAKQRIRSRVTGGQRISVAFTQAGPVVPQGIDFWALGEPFDVSVRDTAFASNLAEVQAALRTTDVVFAQDEGIRASTFWARGERLQDDIVRWLEASPCFRLDAERADRTGKRMYAYVRVEATEAACGAAAESGS